MKKLILIPTALLATTTPMISIVGCSNKDKSDRESCLTIEALNDCEVYLENATADPESNLVPDLHYSIDYGNEHKYEFVPHGDGPHISLTKGQKIRFWGNNPRGFNFYDGDDDTYIDNYFHVQDKYTNEQSGVYNLSGNIMSLIDNGRCRQETMPNQGCFESLFCVSAGNDSIVDSSNLILPTKLTSYCFYEMFENNNKMVAGPALLSEEMTEACYAWMFSFCSSLTSFNILPAKELKEQCYLSMFQSSGIQKPPIIKATKLDNWSCCDMFWGCESLNYSFNDGIEDNLFFTCPNTDGLTDPVKSMFGKTLYHSGDTPKTNDEIYWIAED